MALLEVCCESTGSALTAECCGAGRIEFCDNISEGGTTPSAGSIVVLRRELGISLCPIIRPRGGDFVYSDDEFEAMRRDIELCGETGCDGVVFGILDREGNVDSDRCRTLVDIADSYGMEAAFHRAFDVCAHMESALEDIIETGFVRILTSGGAKTAPEGIETIARMVVRAAGRIAIMPGSGVTPANAAGILEATGCRDIHGTFRSRYRSESPGPAWADYTRWQTDPAKVKEAFENIKNI